MALSCTVSERDIVTHLSKIVNVYKPPVFDVQVIHMSVRVPGRQKLQMTAKPRLAQGAL